MTMATRLGNFLKDARRRLGSILGRASPTPPVRRTRESYLEEKERQALAELERLKNQMPEH